MNTGTHSWNLSSLTPAFPPLPRPAEVAHSLRDEKYLLWAILLVPFFLSEFFLLISTSGNLQQLMSFKHKALPHAQAHALLIHPQVRPHLLPCVLMIVINAYTFWSGKCHVLPINLKLYVHIHLEPQPPSFLK